MPVRQVRPLLVVLAMLLAPSTASAADSVIASNQEVQGSQCVGLDCVDNEVFGFDTLILKENNTRLKFDDTSTGAGFPANDWELDANDAGSGGNSYFGLLDLTGGTTPWTVMAGAPNNALFVAANGKVGLGTNSPGLNLHIHSSDTPAIRMEQDNSGGFTAQTWDIGANEANWFVRDLTGGSRLPFRIRPGAPTSSIDIAATGNVGVGTATPAQPLHVRRADGSARIEVEEASLTPATRVLADLVNDGAPQLRFSNSAAGATSWLAGPGTGATFVLKPTDAGAVDALTLASNGNATSAGALQQSADPSAEEAATAADPASILTAIKSLPLSTFQYKADGAHAKHLAPGGAAFRTALGLGSSDNALAPGDIATAALAGVQVLAGDTSSATLKSRVDALSTAFDGTKGAVHLLTAGLDILKTKNTRLTTRVTKLEKANRSLAKRLRRLERKVAAL